MSDGGRPSRAPGWWDRLSTTWKVLGVIGAMVSTGITIGLAYAAKSAEYSTDAERDAGDKALGEQVTALSARVDGLAKREDVDRAVGALRQEADQRAKAQRQELIAVFEMLVSGHAADLEPDRRRKADASAFARTEYRDAIRRGDEPADAAAYARDKRPPWRR